MMNTSSSSSSLLMTFGSMIWTHNCRKVRRSSWWMYFLWSPFKVVQRVSTNFSWQSLLAWVVERHSMPIDSSTGGIKSQVMCSSWSFLEDLLRLYSWRASWISSRAFAAPIESWLFCNYYIEFWIFISGCLREKSTDPSDVKKSLSCRSRSALFGSECCWSYPPTCCRLSRLSSNSGS